MSIFPITVTQEQGREIEIARLHAKLEATARRLEKLSLQQDEDSYRVYSDGSFVAVLKGRGSFSLNLKNKEPRDVPSTVVINYLTGNLNILLNLEANTLQRIHKAEFSYMISTSPADTQNYFADLAPKITTDAVLEA